MSAGVGAIGCTAGCCVCGVVFGFKSASPFTVTVTSFLTDGFTTEAITIVVVPGATAVITPLSVTVAIDGFWDSYINCLFDALSGFTTGTSVKESFTRVNSTVEAHSIDSITSAKPFTVRLKTVAWVSASPDVYLAVITVFPSAYVVTFPEASMDATFSLEECQVICPSAFVALAGRYSFAYN